MRYDMTASVFLGCILTVTVVGLAALGYIVYDDYQRTHVTASSHVPTFHRGDCFEVFGEREIWENSPDGIVERVGKNSYLVLFREAAESRRIDKYASSVPIATFDNSYHKIPCPETWVHHTHKEVK